MSTAEKKKPSMYESVQKQFDAAADKMGLNPNIRKILATTARMMRTSPTWSVFRRVSITPMVIETCTSGVSAVRWSVVSVLCVCVFDALQAQAMGFEAPLNNVRRNDVFV
jgi:hypothetical protein